MADQTITPKVMTLNTFSELATGDYEDLTSSNDGVCAVPADCKCLFHIIDATGGRTTVKFTHGDGVLSGQGDVDNAAVLTQNLNNFLMVESARCKWGAGSDKHSIRITTDYAVKVACIQLPS